MSAKQRAAGARAVWGGKTAGSVWSEWNDLMFQSRPHPWGMERYGLLIDTRSTASLSHTLAHSLSLTHTHSFLFHSVSASAVSQTHKHTHTHITVSPVASPVQCWPVPDKQRPALSDYNDGWPAVSYFIGISQESVRSQAKLQVNSLLWGFTKSLRRHVYEVLKKKWNVLWFY